MKQFLVALLLFSSCYGYTQQGFGSIFVDAFYNTDNQLRHNARIDHLHLCVVGPKKDTIVNDTVDLQFRLLNLPPGNYKVVTRYGNYAAIFLDEVGVSADRISFITLLFEPKKKHRRKFHTGC